MPLIPSLERPLNPLRQKAASLLRDKDQRLEETQDALQGDEFRRTRNPYESIKLVTPVFNPTLSAQIKQEIIEYESQSITKIPPAYRFPKIDTPEAWGTNKALRLEPILWVMGRLPSSDSQKETINQLACVIQRVETIAQNRYHEVSHLYLPDPLPMRLPEPLWETVGKPRVLVSYGTRHVTIFKEDGAIQVQCTPERLEKLNYAKRAKSPGVVLLTKPGLFPGDFWKA